MTHCTQLFLIFPIDCRRLKKDYDSSSKGEHDTGFDSEVVRLWTKMKIPCIRSKH